MIQQEDWRPVDGLKLEPDALAAVTTTDQSGRASTHPLADATT